MSMHVILKTRCCAY